MSETAIRAAFLAWWNRVDGDVCGRRREFAEDCWGEAIDAALEWAAGQVEAAGCLCDPEMLDGSRRDASGEIELHMSSCPIALAAKIREGAP